jgi:L-lactate dehydrogenase (cytochrome)
LVRGGTWLTKGVEISTNASYSLADIAAAAPKGATLFFQLYVNTDRAVSERQLAEAERLGIKGIFLTVDAPVPGKREADERVRVADEAIGSAITGKTATNDKRGGGVAR